MIGTKEEVEVIRAVLEKSDKAERTHMGIAIDLYNAGFRMVKTDGK